MQVALKFSIHIILLVVMHALLTINLQLEEINYLPQTPNITSIIVILRIFPIQCYNHHMVSKTPFQPRLPLPLTPHGRWLH